MFRSTIAHAPMRHCQCTNASPWFSPCASDYSRLSATSWAHGKTGRKGLGGNNRPCTDATMASRIFCSWSRASPCSVVSEAVWWCERSTWSKTSRTIKRAEARGNKLCWEVLRAFWYKCRLRISGINALDLMTPVTKSPVSEYCMIRVATLDLKLYLDLRHSNSTAGLYQQANMWRLRC